MAKQSEEEQLLRRNCGEGVQADCESMKLTSADDSAVLTVFDPFLPVLIVDARGVKRRRQNIADGLRTTVRACVEASFARKKRRAIAR